MQALSAKDTDCAGAPKAAKDIDCASSILYDAGKPLRCVDRNCPPYTTLYWCRICGAIYCGLYLWEHSQHM